MVFANVVMGTGLLTEIVAGFRDIVGGRSGAYQDQMNALYASAKEDLWDKAVKMGANAIVGFRVSINEISGKGMAMLMLTAYGTSVTVVPAHEVPVGEGRYDMFDKLLHMKDFLDNGIITQEEYNYECDLIRSRGTNKVSEEVVQKQRRDERERELEIVRQEMKAKAEQRKADAEKARKAEEALREGKAKLKQGVIDTIVSQILREFESSNLTFKTDLKVPFSAMGAPSNLESIIDKTTVTSDISLFDAVTDHIVHGDAVGACAYYLKLNRSSDYDDAIEYVVGTMKSYIGLDNEKKARRLANRMVDAFSAEGINKARECVVSYVEADDSVVSSLLSLLC